MNPVQTGSQGVPAPPFISSDERLPSPKDDLITSQNEAVKEDGNPF